LSLNLTDIAANFNEITGNGEYGVRVVGTPTNGFVLDAINNWWGDASGPNSGGTGDAVSDYVDYEPWLCAPVTEATSDCLCDGGTCCDTCTGGDITVDAEGNHTILTATYDSNPGGSTLFMSGEVYYDIYLDDATGVTSLIIEFCPAEEDTVIYYTVDSEWVACSNQGYVDGCIVVTITETTIPSLSDLTGTPFASGIPYSTRPSEPGDIVDLGDGVGGDVYPVNKLNVVLPWIILGAVIAVGGTALLMKRRVKS